MVLTLSLNQLAYIVGAAFVSGIAVVSAFFNLLASGREGAGCFSWVARLLLAVVVALLMLTLINP